MRDGSYYTTRYIDPAVIGGRGSKLTEQEYDAWTKFVSGQALTSNEDGIVRRVKMKTGAGMPTPMASAGPVIVHTAPQAPTVHQYITMPPPQPPEPEREPIDWDEVGSAVLLIVAIAVASVIIYFLYVVLIDFAAFIKASAPWGYALIFMASTTTTAAFAYYTHKKHRRYDDFV